MTVGMLPWVAKDATSYSFSVAKYGAQCKGDPFNSDHGNGVKPDCNTNVTGNDPHDADVSLLDGPPQTGDPAGSVYRNQWVTALAAAFGTTPHFYNMDNEIDIWAGTHRDVHPNPASYNELRDTYLSEARALKGWDPAAIRFGPVSCCWYFTGGRRPARAIQQVTAGWTFCLGGSMKLLGQTQWRERLLDIFDIHAYPDGPDTSTFTLVQKQALALRLYRDWWDPAYTSEAPYIVTGGFSIEPIDPSRSAFRGCGRYSTRSTVERN